MENRESAYHHQQGNITKEKSPINVICNDWDAFLNIAFLSD